MCTVGVSPRNNVLARREKTEAVLSSCLSRFCRSLCVLPALLSGLVDVPPKLLSSGWFGFSSSSSSSSSSSCKPFRRSSSLSRSCSFRSCLFEVVDPQPFLVPSPPEMGRRDREGGSLGRDPRTLTTRRGRSRSTARPPATQRVHSDRGTMDARRGQQTRDPSRGGHAASAARADGRVHGQRHESRRRAERSSEENRLWSIGKSLTSMLRHGNGGAAGTMSSTGWASVGRLCGLPYLRNLGCEPDDVVEVVRTQDARKRRFELIADDHGVLYVRAVQGRSEGSGVAVSEVNPEVDRDALPAFLVHCTFRRYMSSILSHGLLAGGDRGQAHRLQVHYVDNFPGVGEVGRGIRPGAEIGVIIDPREYAAAGGRFQVTPQEVGGGSLRCYLSGSVPPRFISLIRDIQSRAILYSRDERTPEAKAAAPAPRPASAAPAARMSGPSPKVKGPRKSSPEPTAAQLRIPYFAEIYRIFKDDQLRENQKWSVGTICRKVELGLDVNKDDERKYYVWVCSQSGIEPIPEEAAHFRKLVAPLEKPGEASASSAPPVNAEANESAAGAASASAPSKAREEKKSDESQGSSLGPPGPPPGPPPKKLSKQKSARAESLPAKKTTGVEFLAEKRTGAEFLAEKQEGKDPLSAGKKDVDSAGKKNKIGSAEKKGVESSSADTSGIASTSGSSSAGGEATAGAVGAGAVEGSEPQSAVAKLRKCLAEAATSGKLAEVLSENPKAKFPKEAKVEESTSSLSLFGKLANAVAESSEQRVSLEDVVPSEMLKSEQDRVEKLADNPEDPGSEVDWGDESVKGEKEEPSSEGDEGEEKPIVPASAAEPAAVPGDSPAGAVDPLKELTEEELKLVAIWAHRPAGYQRAVECLLLGAHKLLEKEAATKEGERAALEKSISEDLGLSTLPGEVLNRLVAGAFSVEEEAELEKLETSQTKLAVQARAVRLQSLRRLLNHASTAGSVLEARLRSTGVFAEVVEAFDKAEANRRTDDQARDALFRRQIADIQAGRSTRTVPQVVREARRRLRAKKHRLQVSAKLNAEISAALREKVLDGSRDVRLTPDASWRVEDNLSELKYPPGTWWCRRCQGTSQGTSDCQGYHKGKRCDGSFATTFHSWARTSVGAELLRAAGKRRSERVREEIAPQLKDAGWTCNRCQADNLALRNKWKLLLKKGL